MGKTPLKLAFENQMDEMVSLFKSYRIDMMEDEMMIMRSSNLVRSENLSISLRQNLGSEFSRSIRPLECSYQEF